MRNLSFTNLRVFIDKSAHPIYTELTSRAVDKAEEVPFIKMPDLFMVAACAGAKYERYKKLEQNKRDIFVADAFDSKIQLPLLVALAHKKNKDLEILSDAKEILSVCENWANGGIYIIHEQMLGGKGLRPLYKLVDFILEETK